MMRDNRFSLLLAGAWLLLRCTRVARGLPSVVYGDALGATWFINESFSGRYVDDNTFSHSSSVFSIKADAFAYGALVLSNSDRAAGREIAKMVFFYNPRGPALASLRSRESVDLILAASLPRGGGHTALAKLCTLNADLSADLPVGVDVTISNNYLTTNVNAPGGAFGTAVGVCSIAKPPDSNGWFRITVWLNPFIQMGWDQLHFKDALGTGADFFLDDVVAFQLDDVPAAPPEVSLWLGNAARCRQLMATVFFVCTVPPSNDCCGAFQAFNDFRCFCIPNVVAQGGNDLQVAKMFSGRDQCMGATLIDETDASCTNAVLAGIAMPPPPPGKPSVPQLPAAPGPASSPPPRPFPPPTPPRVAAASGPPSDSGGGGDPPPVVAAPPPANTAQQPQPGPAAAVPPIEATTSNLPPPLLSQPPQAKLPPPPATPSDPDSSGRQRGHGHDGGEAERSRRRAALEGLQGAGPYVAIVACVFGSYALVYREARRRALAEWAAEKGQRKALLAAIKEDPSEGEQ